MYFQFFIVYLKFLIGKLFFPIIFQLREIKRNISNVISLIRIVIFLKNKNIVSLNNFSSYLFTL